VGRENGGGEWEVKRGMAAAFLGGEGMLEWRSACVRWRQRRPVGLSGKDEGRAADRVGPPVSEGRRRGRLGQKEEEGRWATAGPKIGNGPKFKK
jgi:hypothetical protein